MFFQPVFFTINTKNDENRNKDTVSDDKLASSSVLLVEAADKFHLTDEYKHPKVEE